MEKLINMLRSYDKELIILALQAIKNSGDYSVLEQMVDPFNKDRGLGGGYIDGTILLGDYMCYTRDKGSFHVNDIRAYPCRAWFSKLRAKPLI